MGIERGSREVPRTSRGIVQEVGKGADLCQVHRPQFLSVGAVLNSFQLMLFSVLSVGAVLSAISWCCSQCCQLVLFSVLSVGAVLSAISWCCSQCFRSTCKCGKCDTLALPCGDSSVWCSELNIHESFTAKDIPLGEPGYELQQAIRKVMGNDKQLFTQNHCISIRFSMAMCKQETRDFE